MTDRFAVSLYERLFIPKPWVGPIGVESAIIDGLPFARISRQAGIVVMQLDLTRYRQPLGQFAAHVPAGRGRGARATPTGSWRRSTSRSTSTRTRTGSGWSATCGPSSSWRAAGASSRSGCRSTRRSTCGICRRRRCRPSAGARGRGGRSRDQLLPRRPDRPERAAARAVLPGAADEAAVPGGLPRALPAVRHQPEHRRVRLRARVGRPAARARSRQLKIADR